MLYFKLKLLATFVFRAVKRAVARGEEGGRERERERERENECGWGRVCVWVL